MQLFCRFVFLFLLLTEFVVVQACSVKVRVTNWPPFYFQDSKGNWTGLTVDLARAFLREADCEAEYLSAPWARSLLLMKQGKLDMMMNLSVNDERSEYIHFIGPQIEEKAQLILRENIKVRILSLEDIKKIPGRIAYDRGTWLGEQFQNMIENDPSFASKFDVYHTDEINLRKLNAGRIVGIVDFTYEGITSRKDLLTNGFKVDPYVIHANPVYFGFSKQSVSDRDLEMLHKAFNRVKLSGEFIEITDRYK